MDEIKEDLVVVKIEEINPVDFYNKHYIKDTFTFMLSLKNITMTGFDSFTYVKNVDDANKRMVVIEHGMFVVKMENGLGLKEGESYSPFMLMQMFKFNNKFNLTMNWVVKDLMHNGSDYVRIGFKYFKLIEKVDRFDIVRKELKFWEKQTILDDYTKTELEIIPRYDDFTIVPNNKAHSQIIGNNYNLYSEFSHEPCGDAQYLGVDGCEWSLKLLKHIFGEQYELGLQYMKILYDMPKQILPILVLTSTERETGKSTFIDWLCIIFGDNMVVVNPQDISNSFNGTYADKNIIAIEESKFEGTQTLEKLKALATQKKLTVNTKFISQYSVPFYGKLIITSNDESKFSRVDTEEIRYWVRQIPSLTGKANHEILRDLVKEIPQFLHYLDTLPTPDTSKSRMAFTAEQLQTSALATVKKESLPSLHKEIVILLDEHCAENDKVEYIKFTAKSMKTQWFENNHRIEINYINRILKDSLKLDKGEPEMQRHIPFELNNPISQKKISGRVYVYKNPYYNESTQRRAADY